MTSGSRLFPLACALATLVSGGVQAQQLPAIELSGGYAFLRLPQHADTGLTAAGVNGWQAALALRFRPRVAFVFDFGGNYGHRRLVPTQFQRLETSPGSFRQHTILFGPEVRVLTGSRLRLNVRALIGPAYVDPLVLPLREPFLPPPDLLGNVPPPVTEFRLGVEKPLTGAIGGSVEYRITDRLSYRILQPELVVTHLGGTVNRTNFRISTGMAVRFGGF